MIPECRRRQMGDEIAVDGSREPVAGERLGKDWNDGLLCRGRGRVAGEEEPGETEGEK